MQLCLEISGSRTGSFPSFVYVFLAFDPSPFLTVSANLRFLSLSLAIVCPYQSTVHLFLALPSQRGHFSGHGRVFVHLIKKRKCEQGGTILVLLLMHPSNDSITKE